MLKETIEIICISLVYIVAVIGIMAIYYKAGKLAFDKAIESRENKRKGFVAFLYRMMPAKTVKGANTLTVNALQLMTNALR